VPPAPQETFRPRYILGGNTACSLLLKPDLWQGRQGQASSPEGMAKGHVSSRGVRAQGWSGTAPGFQAMRCASGFCQIKNRSTLHPDTEARASGLLCKRSPSYQWAYQCLKKQMLMERHLPGQASLPGFPCLPLSQPVQSWMTPADRRGLYRLYTRHRNLRGMGMLRQCTSLLFPLPQIFVKFCHSKQYHNTIK